ncbi:hypothetical protein FGO68_gene8767 [Halteria grandinella]|uniref:Uncharacterized protein n=1 Tax=Halteria grandinella TaxID=5974 RepID=A0A8J8SUU7_HALGN|nr:hypothetical protein FGO68_gene8767 [Halteria grandinella]
MFRLHRCIGIAIPVLSGGIAAAFVTGCAGGSAGGTLASGRTVTANSDSLFLRSQFTKDSATIRTAGKQIVVAPKSLIVDGVPVAKIEEETKDVQVNVKNGNVTFQADGADVETAADH